MSARFHDHLRARPGHPHRSRPVVLNTWEAVYFDHDLDRLTHLADLGAEVGVERFVLDDGRFRHRRDDRSGLGDWYVDETVWPGGLRPLIDHVRAPGALANAQSAGDGLSGRTPAPPTDPGAPWAAGSGSPQRPGAR
ncbi:alpha-galactosidase [Streptomyces sp. NBC_00391]|uniref:alpha-galactosidase n=1 Tax=Streptomyces sp. NBC_00391 TaxID=2903647 RepID=UPI002E1B3F05